MMNKILVLLSICTTFIMFGAGSAYSQQDSFANMDYSQFLDFCKEHDPALWDSMSVNERLVSNLCHSLSEGFDEKQWVWLNGTNLDWKNFAQKKAEEYANGIQLYQEQGIKNSLVVETFVSGRDSFPPPMSAMISFDYASYSQTKQYKNEFMIMLSGLSEKDHVQYDFSKEERFTLHPHIEKTPLPSDIRQSMLDWCADASSSAKNNERFWDAVPIRILSNTPEFQALQGEASSFVIHLYAAQESCPPIVEMVGTFTSKDGDKHRFAMSYAGDFFRYQIDETYSLEYQALAPLKQIKNGISLVEVKCDEGKYPAYRYDRMRVACVSEETQVKLINRGWATMRLINPGDNIAQALCNNYEGKWHSEHEGCRGITDLQCSLMGGKFVDNLRICYDGICPDKGYSLCVTNPDSYIK